MSNDPIVHRDMLGNELTLGATICFCDSSLLKIGIIGKFTEKMVRVHALTGANQIRERGFLKYPEQIVLVPSADVTMYILKNSG